MESFIIRFTFPFSWFKSEFFKNPDPTWDFAIQYPRIMFSLLTPMLHVVWVLHQEYTGPTPCCFSQIHCFLGWPVLFTSRHGSAAVHMDCLWPTILTVSLTWFSPLAPYQLQIFLGKIFCVLPGCCKIRICRWPKKSSPSTPALVDRSPADADPDTPSALTGSFIIWACFFVHFTHLICGALMFLSLVEEATWC